MTTVSFLQRELEDVVMTAVDRIASWKAKNPTTTLKAGVEGHIQAFHANNFLKVLYQLIKKKHVSTQGEMQINQEAVVDAVKEYMAAGKSSKNSNIDATLSRLADTIKHLKL